MRLFWSILDLSYSLDDGNKHDHELHWSSGHAHPREEHAAHRRLWVRRVGSTARVVAVEGVVRRLVSFVKNDTPNDKEHPTTP